MSYGGVQIVEEMQFQFLYHGYCRLLLISKERNHQIIFHTIDCSTSMSRYEYKDEHEYIISMKQIKEVSKIKEAFTTTEKDYLNGTYVFLERLL